MKVADHRLGFIGFGHMAQILFERLDAARLIPRSHVQFVQRDRDRMKRNEEKYGITATSLKHLIESSDILLLCVRPMQVGALAAEMAHLGAGKKKIFSIAAGLTIDYYRSVFGANSEIVRVMPNVASGVGDGMTILSFAKDASQELRSLAQLFVAPFGKSLEIPEAEMDAATAVAGSGPGFVFKLIEAMAEGGIKSGLSPKQALLMASQAFLGAARLVVEGGDLSSLMIEIATPGGTTEAGYRVMEQTNVAEHIEKTIQATVEKAKSFN